MSLFGTVHIATEVPHSLSIESGKRNIVNVCTEDIITVRSQNIADTARW